MRVFHVVLLLLSLSGFLPNDDDEGVVVDEGEDRPISKRPWRWSSSIDSSSTSSREFIDTPIGLFLEAATAPVEEVVSGREVVWMWMGRSRRKRGSADFADFSITILETIFVDDDDIINDDAVNEQLVMMMTTRVVGNFSFMVFCCSSPAPPLVNTYVRYTSLCLSRKSCDKPCRTS